MWSISGQAGGLSRMSRKALVQGYNITTKLPMGRQGEERALYWRLHVPRSVNCHITTGDPSTQMGLQTGRPHEKEAAVKGDRIHDRTGG